MMIRNLYVLLCLSTIGHTSAGRLGGRVAFVRSQQLNRHLEEDDSTTRPTLQIVGDNGNPDGTFPLAKCEGDCDSSKDCAGDLRCYFRRYTEEAGPPGCEGVPVDGTDFCFDPADDPQIPPVGTLYRIGQDGDPSWAFPLRRCMGDCDGDNDCLGNLKCFKRNQGNRPPGCIGEGVGTADFCYDPADETKDVVLDNETTTKVNNDDNSDETQAKSIEGEDDGDSNNGAVVGIVIAVVVVVLLIGGYWYYSRRSENETDNQAPLKADECAPEIRENTGEHGDKAHETDESEEHTETTS